MRGRSRARKGRRVAPRRWIALAPALIAILAVAPSASATTLTGPDKVKPGTKVTFKATGFQPNKRLFVYLKPTRDRALEDACAVPITGFRTDSTGAETLRFKFPRRCTYPGTGNKAKWKTRGKKVDVFVSARDYSEFARKVVRLTGGGGGLPTETFKIRGGKTEITLRCDPDEADPCRGKLTIKATVKRRHLGGGKGRRKINVIKKQSYSIPVGGAKTYTLKLTKPAKQYFKRKRSLVGKGLLAGSDGRKTRFKAVMRR